MTAEAPLAERRITLLLPGERVPPEEASLERVLAAVDRANARARLAGHPDGLNPIVLDPARVRAFVEGLSRLPAGVLDRLAGRFLFLGEGLGLAASSPIEPEAIARGYTLALPDEDEAVVQARLLAPVRREHAEALAARAEEATRAMDAEVAALERRRDEEGGLGALTHAQRRRFAAARVWKLAAEALAGLEPASEAAGERARAADEAASRFATPPWTGLPRPGG